MGADYSYAVLERMLQLKKYKNRNDVIDTCTSITQIICLDDKINATIRNSYKEALKKLKTLSFGEMKEIIVILESYDDDSSEDDENKQDVLYDGSRDYEAGVVAYEKKEFMDAYQHFQRAAEYGHARAQHSLGLCLFYGIGTAKDKLAAIKQFAIASDMGIKKSDAILQSIIDKRI